VLDTNTRRRTDTPRHVLVRKARKLKNQGRQIAIALVYISSMTTRAPNRRSLTGLVVKFVGSKKNEVTIASIQKSAKAVRHAGNS